MIYKIADQRDRQGTPGGVPPAFDAGQPTWLLIYPGLALSITLFALNFLGDGLRDALDVRASRD